MQIGARARATVSYFLSGIEFEMHALLQCLAVHDGNLDAVSTKDSTKQTKFQSGFYLICEFNVQQNS